MAASPALDFGYALLLEGPADDRRAATVSGIISLLFWLLSYKWLEFALATGVAVAILATVVGLISQARVAAQIHKTLLSP